MYRFKAYSLLALITCVFLFLSRSAMALPVFENVFFFTERVEWMPGPDNWGYQFGGIVYDSDSGNSIISITSQEISTGFFYSLEFDGYEWGLHPSSAAAPDLTQMLITATNNNGETNSYTTNLINLILLDYATNIVLSGDLLAPTISWDSVLYAEKYRIRIYEGSSQIFTSMGPDGDFDETSFTMPTGILESGKDYRIRISASDIQDGILMNRSSINLAYSTTNAPVPEPSSALLLGIGILGLTRLYRRKCQ